MKRKAIEKIAPVQPTKEGRYITTVQMIENILVLNVYKNGQLLGRHALNPKTGEYAQYWEKTKKWSVSKFAALLEVENYGWGYGYSLYDANKKTVFDTVNQEEIVKKVLKTENLCSYRTYDLINEAETEYQKNKREKTENNRMQRINDKMKLVPAIPKDAYQWIWRMEGAEDFAFFNKDTGKWYCTACQKHYTEELLKRADQGIKICHNDMIICPKCGKEVMAKKRTKVIERETHFHMLQRMEGNMITFRHFDVSIIWNSTGRVIYINEAIREIFNGVKTEVYFNQSATKVWCGKKGWDYEHVYWDDRRNHAQRRSYPGFLYPVELEKALKDTKFQKWSRLLPQLAITNQRLDYDRMLWCSIKNKKIVEIIECLFKGRFNKLLYETSTHFISWATDCYIGELNINGKSIEEVFRIQDRQLINRIRDVDGGEKMMLWMRWSCKYKQKISQETLEWLNNNDISQNDVKFIEKKMSLQQIMNYVSRQQAESYKSKTAKAVISQWKDYLEMLETLGRKADDEMMYRPRELKRRHDECVEEIRRQQIIAEMKRNPKERAAEARRMRDKFPGAEEVLKEIKRKYEYQNDKYIILVPQKLIDIVTEGQALHHCAGTTDRYFDRIMQRETYICFLRKKDYPKVPFYTIEVEPSGTIRQHRGMYDEEPGINEIKPFLKEWQKEIKKRLSKKDHEYAKSSAVKRQENIEELKAKNNTKVLKGLMEDFMEAI